MREPPILAACLLAWVGCGDDGRANPDATPPVDAAPDARPCTLVAPSYPDLGSRTGEAVVQPIDDTVPDGPKYLALSTALDQAASPDLLVLELWDGQGAFEGGFSATTISIVDDETDLLSCSVCAYVEANFAVGGPINYLMASAGEVTLDEIDPTPDTGRVRGSATDLVLREVTVDADGQHVVPGGCRTDIAGVAFDFTVAAP